MKYILLILDFSKSVDNLINVAAGMAKRQNSKLILLSVLRAPFFDFGFTSKKNNQLIQEHSQKLEAIKKRIAEEYGVESISFIEKGSTHKKLVEYKKKFRAELVLAGRGSRSSLKASEISFNLKIISVLRCPVITVPYNYKEEDFEKVLFPVRYVKGVSRKFQVVKNIINRNHSKVHFLGIEDEAQYGMKPKLKGMMETMCNEVDKHGLPQPTCSFEKTDNPAEVILKEIRNQGTDLAIINPGKNIFSGEKVDRKFASNLIRKSNTAIMFINSAAAKNYGQPKLIPVKTI